MHALPHEMTGPWAATRGSAELLESPLPEPDRARFAASIRAQSERLAQMIDKLLALAAVEHRQRIEQPESVALEPLAREVIESCEARLVQRPVQLELRVDRATSVNGDPFLLRQALANLVDNAVDFAPPGSMVEVRLDRADGHAVVEVADRGPGVPDYALPRVFERFYSLPRPGGGSRSSGLGLCFVAEVAALHGGRAGLTNRQGGGATARLVLPTGQ